MSLNALLCIRVSGLSLITKHKEHALKCVNDWYNITERRLRQGKLNIIKRITRSLIILKETKDHDDFFKNYIFVLTF